MQFNHILMTAIYNISTHLNRLHQFIKDLEHYKKIIDRKTFLSDKMVEKAIERTLQQSLEAMITVGEMLIAEHGFKKPDKNRNIFEILGEEKIYPQKLVPDLVDLAEFRNVLVHDYVTLDLNKVYKNLLKAVPIFRQYIRCIARYLE